jgi:hypothetical protein
VSLLSSSACSANSRDATRLSSSNRHLACSGRPAPAEGTPSGQQWSSAPPSREGVQTRSTVQNPAAHTQSIAQRTRHMFGTVTSPAIIALGVNMDFHADEDGIARGAALGRARALENIGTVFQLPSCEYRSTGGMVGIVDCLVRTAPFFECTDPREIHWWPFTIHRGDMCHDPGDARR